MLAYPNLQQFKDPAQQFKDPTTGDTQGEVSCPTPTSTQPPILLPAGASTDDLVPRNLKSLPERLKHENVRGLADQPSELLNSQAGPLKFEK